MNKSTSLLQTRGIITAPGEDDTFIFVFSYTAHVLFEGEKEAAAYWAADEASGGFLSVPCCLK